MNIIDFIMKKPFNDKLYKKKFVRYLKDKHAYASFVYEFSKQRYSQRTRRFTDKSLNFTLEHLPDYYEIKKPINLKTLVSSIIDGSLTFLHTKRPRRWCELVTSVTYPPKAFF